MLVLTVAIGLGISTATAHAAISFTDPAALPRSLPGDKQLPGWEPSLAFDPAGDGHFYAVAPGGEEGKGAAFWGSADDGLTWPFVRAVGSQAGGFDSDVEVGTDHTIYVADLEASSSAICRSHDFGKSFSDGCEEGTAEKQAGAEEDRQWLTASPNDAKVVYFTYHDLAAQFPTLLKSSDGGNNFAPCGNLVYPAGPLVPAAFGNTIVGKAAVGRDETIAVPIGSPTPAQVAGPDSVPAYGQITLAVHRGCNGSDQFDNTDVYHDDGASFSNLFVFNVIGPDGTIYVLAAGKLNEKDSYNAYVWTSRDAGKSFGPPQKVNGPNLKANVMPAIAAGTKAGQVVVGWYGSENATDPNDTKGEWRYYVARSSDYGASWDQATITRNVFHFGDVCTVGILCTSGNRNLLDFSSVGVDPKSGCATTVFPGDPFDTFDREKAGDTDPAAAYIALQNDGSCGINSSPSGEQGVQGARSGCQDRTGPVSTLGKRSHLSRKGIALRGTTRDRGCGRNGRGKVARVTLAIGRRVGKKCQWLRPKKGFGPVGSCTRKVYVRAKGTSKWTFRLRRSLKRGTYVVVPRAFDAVGNRERSLRGSRRGRHNHNRYLFRVR